MGATIAVAQGETKLENYRIAAPVSADRIAVIISSQVAAARQWVRAGWLEVLEGSTIGELQVREFEVQFQAQALELPSGIFTLNFCPVWWIEDFLFELFEFSND